MYKMSTLEVAGGRISVMVNALGCCTIRGSVAGFESLAKHSVVLYLVLHCGCLELYMLGVGRLQILDRLTVAY